jgi:hypothetical protein
MTDNTKKKMSSRRFWIVIWAMVYVSVLSVVVIIKDYDAAWIAGTMAVVSSIVVSYVTVSSMKKPKEEVK